MHYYFILQHRRWNRTWTEWGLPPVLGGSLLVAVWVLGSAFLFSKTDYAAWLYVALAVALLSRLSAQARVDELGRLFGTPERQQVRLVENGAVALPFVGYLVYQAAWVPALVLGGAAVAGAFGSQRTWGSWAMPTPFGQHPFEFAVGVRQSWLGLLLLHVLLGIGWWVGNGNLSAVCYGGLWVVLLNYYASLEPVTYVWWHCHTPAEFLRYKLGIALLHSLLLVAPAALWVLFGFEGDYWKILLLVTGIGWLVQSILLLGKYTVFPQPMGLPHLIWLLLGMSFPPLLVVLVIVFYRRACANLESLL